MKRKITYLLIFILTILNIKCIGDFEFDWTPKPSDYYGETITVKVKEYKTNLPVSGAKFSTYYCTEFDQYIGCTNKILLSSCITNNNGVCDCIFPKKAFKEINIEKSMYWTKSYSQIVSSNEYIIQPEAWVTIKFNTNVQYPSTSGFIITVNGELGSGQQYAQEANNSSIAFRLFGNEVNTVSWSLSGNSQILNSGSFTLYPNKFENLEYTLNY